MAGLEQKVTLVTGSTKGIGRAIVSAFTERGARVIVHGRDPDEVRGTTEALGAYGGVAGDLSTDLTADEPYENQGDGNFGFDTKYGVTKSLIFDLSHGATLYISRGNSLAHKSHRIVVR